MLSLFSCTKEKEFLNSEINENEINLSLDEKKAFIAMKLSHKIEIEEARDLAEKATSMFDRGNLTKSERTISHVSIGVRTATKGNSADTMLYIFNYSNNKGYVIISADERSEGVIAFIEKGNLNIGDTLNDRGAGVLLSNIESYQQAQINEYNHLKDSLGTQVLAKIGSIEDFKELTTKSVGGTFKSLIYPMVKTQWGQGTPFNSYAVLKDGVRCKAGCFAVAVSQLVAYHGSPSNFNGTFYNLENIRNRSSVAEMSAIEIDQMARFIAVIGHMCSSDWGVSSTSSTDKKARTCLRDLGYTTPWDPQDYNLSLIKNSLYNKRPVLIGGYSHRKSILGIYSHSGGHEWLIDGLGEVRTISAAVGPNGIIQQVILQEFLHCNFGWVGGDDGYYLAGVFNTNEGPSFTKSSEPYNYQFKIQMFSNVCLNN